MPTIRVSTERVSSPLLPALDPRDGAGGERGLGAYLVPAAAVRDPVGEDPFLMVAAGAAGLWSGRLNRSAAPTTTG